MLVENNLVITLLEVNSLTLHNLHYIVLALCKAARSAQIKGKIEILVHVTWFYVSSKLFVVQLCVKAPLHLLIPLIL